jgi:hypothetical protein
VIRGRYYKSIERPAALTPNVPVEYVIPYPATDHAFQAGHRIMVQVQSTWFPVIDLNPQAFVPNIFLAQPSDFTAATQRIYRSGARVTHRAADRGRGVTIAVRRTQPTREPGAHTHDRQDAPTAPRSNGSRDRRHDGHDDRRAKRPLEDKPLVFPKRHT